MDVNGYSTQFKLDTGADVTVIGSDTPWLKYVKLKDSATNTLNGPGSVQLKILGTFAAKITANDSSIKETIYVIESQSYPLLSRRACEALQLVKPAACVTVAVAEITADQVRTEHPELFQGLGQLQEPYRIHLKEDAKPYCLYTPRRIAQPLLPKVQAELESMEKLGVITPVTEPTQWCSGIVPVIKKNGSVRLCVDLTHLNASVRREIHPMFSVDESLAKLGKSTVFSKLDANSGFWQIPLHAESKHLTTFVTPFGRYRFERLPFGISAAPEVFQRTMTKLLTGLDGVVCHLDDILIHGVNQAEHDQRLKAVLSRLESAGLTLNNKCEFSKRSITFLGHIIEQGTIKADPKKISAIKDFPQPTNITELQRFNGMVNQLGKFIPHLAQNNEPLRQLLHKDRQWLWSSQQEKAFQHIKDALINPPVLATYDSKLPTIVAADSSTYGLGAVLLQVQPDGKRLPVSFASRSLSAAEANYAVIEKEALAITWACEKFSDYVLGLDFTVETDHKPLVPLLTITDLPKLPVRILRFRLRLMRFSPVVTYVKGKDQCTADALSRAPVDKASTDDDNFVGEVEAFANAITKYLPSSADKLTTIKQAQLDDDTLSRVRDFCISGWPKKLPDHIDIQNFMEHQAHITLVNDLLMYDDRIIIPSSMQQEILTRIHDGHLGISKSRQRANTSVWWPGISRDIANLVQNCTTCQKLRPTPHEPLLVSPFPSRPWEKLGMDLFELDKHTYLIVVDYFSRWPEIRKLDGLTANHVIMAVKGIFAVHGIPDTVVSDNGPQFSAYQFKEFSDQYQFTHITSSPRYPQANGEAERAVRTVKELLIKNSDDPSLALLTYRATPLANGLSPGQLLMGRQLQTLMPIVPDLLKKRVTEKDVTQIREWEDQHRKKQTDNFNKRHRATDLSDLAPGTKVWIRDQDVDGYVVQNSHPRSYSVKTDKGVIRRNRSALVSVRDTDVQPMAAVMPDNQLDVPDEQLDVPDEQLDVPDASDEQNEETDNVHYKTKSGRVVKPVQRLDL